MQSDVIESSEKPELKRRNIGIYKTRQY